MYVNWYFVQVSTNTTFYNTSPDDSIPPLKFSIRLRRRQDRQALLMDLNAWSCDWTQLCNGHFTRVRTTSYDVTLWATDNRREFRIKSRANRWSRQHKNSLQFFVSQTGTLTGIALSRAFLVKPPKDGKNLLKASASEQYLRVDSVPCLLRCCCLRPAGCLRNHVLTVTRLLYHCRTSGDGSLLMLVLLIAPSW